MQIRELHKQITATLTKAKVLQLTEIVKREDYSIHDLIDLTFDHNQQIGFRASWILENLLLTDPTSLLENLDELLLRLPQVFNQSCRRHYAKIFVRLTSPKISSEIKIKLKTSDFEPVVETCFDWLIDAEVAVAVKVLCCEILFNLKNRYVWIDDELGKQVEFLMKNGSAAMQSKGKKILAALHVN